VSPPSTRRAPRSRGGGVASDRADAGDVPFGARPDIVATALATIGRPTRTSRARLDRHRLLLAATAVTPLYGKLSDIYGRRPFLLAGVAIFVVGSLACALSTMPALIARARCKASAAVG